MYTGSVKNNKQPIGASAKHKLGPWAEQEVETHPFATIESKDHVGDAILWAQLATLNPGSPFERYMPHANMQTPRTHQVEFSPNVVRIDVYNHHAIFS